MIDNIIQQIILKTGPIVSATRPFVWNKTLKRYVEGRLTGYVENYDCIITKFYSKEQAEKVIESERARWHYYKSLKDLNPSSTDSHQMNGHNVKPSTKKQPHENKNREK